jgi:hypothetical protein
MRSDGRYSQHLTEVAYLEKGRLMTASTPLDHFSASQIRTALDELDPAHADLLSDFIGRIGGLENAALAVELLAELES